MVPFYNFGPYRVSISEEKFQLASFELQEQGFLGAMGAAQLPCLPSLSCFLPPPSSSLALFS
jgi:hypothetical protein